MLFRSISSLKGNPIKHQKGQSLVEGLVALPLFFLLAAAIVQLIWLFLAQQLLISATSYVALYAATAPEDTLAQQAVFQQRIKPLGQHVPLPHIHLVLPDKKQAQAVADYNANTQTFTLDPVYAKLQLKEKYDVSLEEAEQWLQLSNLEVQVRWCFKLKVPVVAKLIKKAFSQGDGACGVESLLLTGVYVPLTSTAKVPLHRKREWHY
ncbi:hypothetical protein CWE15_01100 [Aliidiomarina taiwanensis]|uniref:Pilus assembly protein n=1 Tax=Aliidiomarina taiwanensis TaxID=946228 RepID=A0A432X8W2_9GAMM|nr:TadE family protein [Aliidiomarina taiwanensis]RUO43828.1 hypothetical protein CWE15_01100 [Aliidiomarina taiwanensis]